MSTSEVFIDAGIAGAEAMANAGEAIVKPVLQFQWNVANQYSVQSQRQRRMVWTNAPRRVYHGTIEANAAKIMREGIDAAAGRPTADFGQGFYVTSDLHQAQQWANRKARYVPRARPRAAVLTFMLDRDRIGALGDHLVFVLADADFYEFVSFNRFGSRRHGRTSGAPYDVVYGPVAAFPQQIAYANCDQICFVAGSGNANIAARALGPPQSVDHGDPYF